MTKEELAKSLNIGYEICCDIADALDGVGFTEDQMIAIIKAISILKLTN